MYYTKNFIDSSQSWSKMLDELTRMAYSREKIWRTDDPEQNYYRASSSEKCKKKYRKIEIQNPKKLEK